MLQLETLAIVMAMMAMTGQYYASGGIEHGRLNARLRFQRYNQGLRNQEGQKRDSNRFDGSADQKARFNFHLWIIVERFAISR